MMTTPHVDTWIEQALEAGMRPHVSIQPDGRRSLVCDLTDRRRPAAPDDALAGLIAERLAGLGMVRDYRSIRA